MTRIKEPKENKGRDIKSAVVIARLLKTEGFTDYTANGVESYWRRSAGLNVRQQRQIERLEKDISRITKDMSASDRLAFGRFIGLHKKMSFDVGLKIGLQTFAQKNAYPVEEQQANGKTKKGANVKSRAALQEAAQTTATKNEAGQEIKETIPWNF